MGFEGVPNEISLKRHADKTEYLVMFHGREESVKSTNVAHDKRMSTDSSPKLEHAAWQKWRSSFVAPPTHAVSVRSDPA